MTNGDAEMATTAMGTIATTAASGNAIRPQKRCDDGQTVLQWPVMTHYYKFEHYKPLITDRPLTTHQL